MEAEIRAIPTTSVGHHEPAEDLFSTLLGHFGDVGGVDLVIPERSSPARAADFSA